MHMHVPPMVILAIWEMDQLPKVGTSSDQSRKNGLIPFIMPLLWGTACNTRLHPCYTTEQAGMSANAHGNFSVTPSMMVPHTCVDICLPRQ